MSAKSSRNASASEADISNLSAMNLWADLPRRQLALLTRSASVLYRGSETLRTIQQQAAQRATEHHQEAAEKLDGPCDFSEMMAIQADLLRFNMQEAAQYWQQLATAAFRIQVDMVSGAGQALEPAATDPTLDSLQRAFAATLNGGAAAAATH